MSSATPVVKSLRALLRGRAARPAMIALVVALPGVALWTLASRSYFAFDDFWQICVTVHEGLTVHFLRLATFQHFGPSGHFLFWVFVRFFPMQFGPALAMVMLFYFGSVLVFHGILDTLFGRRWATVAVTFLFATSLFWVESVDWFGVGVQRVTATFFTLLALYSYLRFAYHRRARWLVLSVVAYCAALGFFIGPILLPLYLFVLRLFILGDKSDLRINEAFRILWREGRVWIGYAIAATLYLINYFHLYYYSSPRPKVGDVLNFLQLAWLRTLIPGILGFQPVQTLNGTGLTKVLFAQAIFVLLVVVSLRYRPGAWRGWAFAVVTYLPLILMSAGQRISDFGVGVAYSQRYFLDPSWLLILGGTLALLPHRQAYGTRLETSPRRPLPHTTLLAGLAVVLLLGHAVLVWRSGNAILDAWAGTTNKVYFEHLTADLNTLQRRGQILNLADVAVPENMIGSWMTPYNNASNVFVAMPQPLVYDDFSQPLWVPDDTGRLHRAFFTGVAGGLVGALKDAHVLRTSSAFSGKERLCGVASHRARLTLTVGPIPGHRYYFQIQTTGKATIRATTTTSLGIRNPPGPMLVVTQPGFSTQALDAASPMRLALDIRPTSRFCVASIVVGTFIAEGPTVGD